MRLKIESLKIEALIPAAISESPANSADVTLVEAFLKLTKETVS